MIQHFMQLLNSPFLGGGLVLMATGSLIALARNVPLTIWGKIKHQFLISATVYNTDPLFDWISVWLNEHPYTKKARDIMAATKEELQKVVDSEDYDDGEEYGRWVPRIIFSPAHGQHFFWYKGNFIWLGREKDDKAKGPTKDLIGSDTGMNSLYGEHYTFTTFGRSQGIIRALLGDVIELTKQERADKVGIYVSTSYGWTCLYSCTPRSLDSVFMPVGVKEDLVADIQSFLTEDSWYLKRGVPYRRGYLLYGPPGNGKTSSISAIAGKLKLNLYSLNLSDGHVDDAQLANLVRSVRPRSILLLEDVDAALHSREEANTVDDKKTRVKPERDKGVTLSGVLNVLDGIVTPFGMLVMMTTNYPERLDAALVRPGRIDKKIEFTNATYEQKVASHLWFYPERGEAAAVKFAKSLGDNVSMATVQEALISIKGEKIEPLPPVEAATEEAVA
jgi:hypothetical protein